MSKAAALVARDIRSALLAEDRRSAVLSPAYVIKLTGRKRIEDTFLADIVVACQKVDIMLHAESRHIWQVAVMANKAYLKSDPAYLAD
jgi:hypothetical protein